MIEVWSDNTLNWHDIILVEVDVGEKVVIGVDVSNLTHREIEGVISVGVANWIRENCDEDENGNWRII